MLRAMPGRARHLGALAATTLVASAAIVVTSPSQAEASTYSVTDATTYASALSAAASDNSWVTINILADFSIDGSSGWYYVGDENFTLNGNGHTITWSGTGDYPLLRTNSGADVTVANITIVGFEPSDDPVLDIEAGGDVMLSGVTMTRNGGNQVVWLDGTNPVVQNSEFTNNTADVIINRNAEIYVSGSTFTGNSGNAVSSNDGAWVVNSTFTGNSTPGVGGAVHSNFGDVKVEYSTFTNNTGRGGAAVRAGSGRVTVYSSSFEGNSSTGDGGGAVYSSQPAAFYSSLFSGNTVVSGGDGGAIDIEGGGTSEVWNSTFVGNSSPSTGGAIYAPSTVLDIWTSTFVDNTATSGGHIFGGDGAVIYGSAFSSMPGGYACILYPGLSRGYNADQDGTCTSNWVGTGDFQPADLKLGSLADNGGPSKTLLPASDSPLVDGISGASCASELSNGGLRGNSVEFDQRGVSRGEALSYQGGGCDIGAVELVKDVSETTTTAKGDVTIAVSGAWDVACLATGTIADAGGTAPAGVAFPHGTLGFCSQLPLSGGTVTVSVTYPSPVTSVWKTGSTWTEIASATLSDGGRTATYTITDGGALDQDGHVDGEITDPVAGGVESTFTG